MWRLSVPRTARARAPYLPLIGLSLIGRSGAPSRSQDFILSAAGDDYGPTFRLSLASVTTHLLAAVSRTRLQAAARSRPLSERVAGSPDESAHAEREADILSAHFPLRAAGTPDAVDPHLWCMTYSPDARRDAHLRRPPEAREEGQIDEDEHGAAEEEQIDVRQHEVELELAARKSVHATQ